MKKVPDIEPYTPSLAADLDVFRKELMRRLSNHQENWRRCREAVCRRQRSCLGDSTVCVRAGRPRRRVSAEEGARMMQQLKRQLAERLAAIDDQEASQQNKEGSARRSAPHRTKSGRSTHRQKASGAP